MNVRKMAKSLVFIALLTTGFIAAPLAAQEDGKKQTTVRDAKNSNDLYGSPNTQPPLDNPYQIRRGNQASQPRFPDTYFNPNPSWQAPGGNNASARIRAAAEAVRDAKDSEAKADAQKKLAEVLSKSYDEDMAQREKELAQVEERLKKLRELFERRRAKKQEIIELQTKVALNEAEGLGFYERERGPQTNIDGVVGSLPRATMFGPGMAPPAPAPGDPTPATAPAATR